jgi:hypothetical protein
VKKEMTMEKQLVDKEQSLHPATYHFGRLYSSMRKRWEISLASQDEIYVGRGMIGRRISVFGL